MKAVLSTFLETRIKLLAPFAPFLAVRFGIASLETLQTSERIWIGRAQRRKTLIPLLKSRKTYQEPDTRYTKYFKGY